MGLRANLAVNLPDRQDCLGVWVGSTVHEVAMTEESSTFRGSNGSSTWREGLRESLSIGPHARMWGLESVWSGRDWNKLIISAGMYSLVCAVAALED